MAAGFRPLATYHSAMTPPLERLALPPERPRGGDIGLRPLDLSDYECEMRRIHALSLECFRANLLFTPLDWQEFAARYRPLRPHLREGLSWVAESGGEPVGFVLGVPDMLQADVDTVILKTLATRARLRGRGIGHALAAQCLREARRRSYRHAVFALIRDGNPSERIVARYAKPIRTYALYLKELGHRMNVYALLTEQARVRPEADAFLEWHGGRFRATSFRELDAASARAAGMLRSAGLRPGDPGPGARAHVDRPLCRPARDFPSRPGRRLHRPDGGARAHRALLPGAADRRVDRQPQGPPAALHGGCPAAHTARVCDRPVAPARKPPLERLAASGRDRGAGGALLCGHPGPGHVYERQHRAAQGGYADPRPAAGPAGDSCGRAGDLRGGPRPERAAHVRPLQPRLRRGQPDPGVRPERPGHGGRRRAGRAGAHIARQLSPGVAGPVRRHGRGLPADGVHSRMYAESTPAGPRSSRGC